MEAYLQESGDLTLALREQESKPYGKLKLTITVERFSPSIFRPQSASVIFETVESTTYQPLMSSVADSLAKIFQMLERERA